MSQIGKPRSGSKFLYQPFECRGTDCAPSHQIVANERVLQERWDGLERRLEAMNAHLARLERRLWMTIVGVAGTVLANAVHSITMTQ